MLTLTSKYEGKLGVMRTYHHPKHGKVEVAAFPSEQGADVLFVGHQGGWRMVVCQQGGQRERWYRARAAAIDAAEQQAAKPKRTRRKRAAAEPAKGKRA